MKIATKLKLAAFIPALLAIIIGTALLVSNKVLQETREKNKASHRIISSVNEMRSLILDYVIYHEERPLLQFLETHQSILKLTAGFRLGNPDQQQILESIGRDMDAMRNTFLKLASNHVRYISEKDSRLIQEVENRLVGRLMVWSRDVVAEAEYLESLIDEERITTQRRIDWLIFSLIVAATLFVTAILAGIAKNISSSFKKLRHGTEVIGAGDFDHRIGMTAPDEFGDLSQAFDYMTEHLQEVTVSKDRLEQEIEERKKIEAALRNHREWLRVTLNSIGDAVISTDIEGRINFINPVASELTGRPPEEANGVPIREVLRTVNEYTQEPAEDIVQRVLDEGRVVNMANHTTLIHRNGSKIPIEDSAAPIKDREGNLLGVVIVFHDVTEKRAAGEALRQSAEKLRIVADFTYDWEYWRDNAGEFLYISPSCQRITGYSREDFMADPELYPRILHPEDRGAVLGHIKEDRAKPELCELEFRIIRRDGQERWIAHVCRAVLNDKGESLGRRVSDRDITERKQAEDILKQHGKELEQRVRERTAELEKRNRELEEFTFIASHDLQEPLRKISTFGDLLLHRYGDTLNEQNRDYIERMRKSAVRMHLLLKSLLEYSRVTSGDKQFDPLDLRKSVNEALSNLEILVQDKGARIEVNDLPVVDADLHQMTQLFQNLIGNALKFQRDGETPQVKIYSHIADQSMQKNGKTYEIFVEDNGIGFEGKKYVKKIFQPFQRLHNMEKYEGVGIGLAICKKIAEYHGGDLTVRSRPGRGSTFIITLPEKQEKMEHE